MSDTINISINGQTVQASPGQTVLQAATDAGISIPTLCNHPHLRPNGSCRVCLVEIEKQRTLQPACTFPVAEGMVVQTETPKVVEARKFSLHMLFSERNHYCMFCPRSGTVETSDCELQRLAYRYGLDSFAYAPAWDKAWPMDATRKWFVMDHSRCILCRRCIAACDLVAATHTLGVQQRGARTMISADDGASFRSSSCVECGTCLQVCPTGALMDRRSSFVGHSCEGKTSRITCVGCAVACGMRAQVRANVVMKLEGDWDESNGGLLCSRGRFESLDMPSERIRKPMIREQGKLREAGWDEAINIAVARLSRSATVAGLISPRFTNETMIAFSAFLNEVLHSDQVALLDGNVPPLDLTPRATLHDLENATCVVIVGGDPIKDQKVLGYLARRACDREASLIVVSGKETGLDDSATDKLHLNPMSHQRPSPFAQLRYSFHLGIEDISRLRSMVAASQRPVVLYGPGLSTIVYAALRSLDPRSRFMPLVYGANACGAARFGIERNSVDAEAVYVMAGDERPDGQAIPEAKTTIVQAAFRSEMTEKADVIFPGRMWTEKRGTIVNLEGRERPVVDITEAPQGIGPDWLPLATMAAVMGRPGLFGTMANVQNSL